MHRLKANSYFFIFLILSLLLFPWPEQDTSTLFELLPHTETGIDFINKMEEGIGKNVLESEFFFNGGGVAVGDLNNDGFNDIYFTANTGENALYINTENFEFENIINKAGVNDSLGWSAGTSMVDINGDGLLDIYVCKSGKNKESHRRNKLFINNGDLTFSEKAAEFGLNDPGYCTQAAFFDYDRDGDMDAYIVNYSVKTHTGFNIIDIRKKIDSLAGDKLYRNNNGSFDDVSEEAGLIQNPIGFGLSVSVSDLNQDGWPDIFVTNDFIEKDYMYMNQGDGTFSEEISIRTHLTSYYSMGSDIADINNDGSPDLLVVDMLPYDYPRKRVFKTPDYNMYDQLAIHNYHRQNMRNTLQLNNSDGTFTEIGRLAGISKTDWSWSSLLADFDNDGHKDIFITNGFPRFYTDLDYLNNVLWEEFPNEKMSDDSKLLYELVRQMSKVELQNFAFKNNGDLSFNDVSQRWGLDQKAVSNGAAYADLNNDGSLDLIVNNINERPFIFKNKSIENSENNYLKVHLQGADKNSYGIGAKVKVIGENNTTYYQENFPVRGYQSSVDPILLFGLGTNEKVKVKVTWPDQTQDVLEDVSVNQTIILKQKKAQASNQGRKDDDSSNKMFALLNTSVLGFDYSHKGSLSGNKANSPLMPHSLKNLGPATANADVNQDGLVDIFIGGGQDQLSSIYLQQSNGTFSRNLMPGFKEHKNREDIDALFFDSNGDGHHDLYVVSGGNSDPNNGPLYQDRLYFNDGFGKFIYAPDALPPMESSGGVVTALDFDNDDDMDLFIGGRVLTNHYPKSPRSYLLENNNGKFRDITEKASSKLVNPGMVTDAVWADVVHDDQEELIITGEWMPIRIFKKTDDQQFEEITEPTGLKNTSGWWNVLKTADLNGDGHTDLIAGNWGLNVSMNALNEAPVVVYAEDFNNDGFTAPILSQVVNGERYPVPDRDLLLSEISSLERVFPDYESYSTASIEDIMDNLQIDNPDQLQLHTFESAVFRNNGDGTFQKISLPKEAQVAPIYDMVVSDFDGDTIPDILAAGNNFGTKSKNGPVSGEGLLLKGDRFFNFTPKGFNNTGLRAPGDVRNIEVLPSQHGPLIILARNNESIVPYLYRGTGD